MMGDDESDSLSGKTRPRWPGLSSGLRAGDSRTADMGHHMEDTEANDLLRHGSRQRFDHLDRDRVPSKATATLNLRKAKSMSATGSQEESER